MIGISPGEILSSSYLQHPRQRDLVGHWPMVARGGDVIADYSRRRNPGTLKNMVPANDWIARERVGYGLNFGGTNEFISLGTDSFYKFLSGAFSISAWIKTSDSIGAIVSRFEPGPPFRGWAFHIGIAGVPNGHLALTNALTHISSDSPVDDGEFHHVVASFDGSDTSLYIDGAIGGSGSHVSPDDPGSVNLEIAGASNFFAGFIGDARIYRRALTHIEVIDLFLDPYREFRGAAAISREIVPPATHYYHGLMAG